MIQPPFEPQPNESSSSLRGDSSDYSLHLNAYATTGAFPELPPSVLPTWRMHRYAPFRPRTILWLSVIFPFSAVYLSALNWRRFGQPRRFWITWIAGSIAVVVLAGLLGRLVTAVHGGRGTTLLGALPLWIGFAYVLNRTQRRWYQAWLATHDQRPANRRETGGWRPYIAAVVLPVALIVIGGMVYVVIRWPQLPDVHRETVVENPNEFAQSTANFQQGDLALSYSTSWVVMAGDRCATEGNSTCILGAEAPGFDGWWRIYALPAAQRTLETYESREHRRLTQPQADLTVSSGDVHSLQVGGYDALTRSFTATDKRTNERMWVQYAIVIAHGEVYYFEFGYGVNGATKFRAEIEAILNSVRFGELDPVT